ncbi:RHS repeat-associated core domain-containing protein [Undibacterium sp. MH2W]|uniref:RHS repeat-associated core domain-containing protein n=1 Tax=Undibacterium sp. MH2W TaxID=3413044 RepID=UPI003BEF9393
MAAGTYSITAKATDNLGVSTTSTPITVTVASGTAKIYDVQTDQINTPRVITDSTGNVVWRWDSTPFGESLPDQNPGHTGTTNDFTFNLRFAGQYYDQETGLHYNYFRDYDPATGRYIQSDPIGLGGGINTYAYVEGDPISKFDPDGLVVAVCSRPANLPGPLGLVHHQWIKTDTIEAGMGATPGVIPGQGNMDLPFTLTQVVNHQGQSKAPNATCEPQKPEVDEDCVNKHLGLGTPTGRWAPWNQCQSFVKEVIQQCTRKKKS